MIDLTPQQLLSGLALRHVTHDREHHRFGEVLERTQHDVNRTRRAIRAPANKVEARTHRSLTRLEVVFGAIGDVAFPEVLRYQCLDRCRHEGCWIMPEQ